MDWKEFSNDGKLVNELGIQVKVFEIRSAVYNRDDALKNVFAIFLEEVDKIQKKVEWVLKRNKKYILVKRVYYSDIPILEAKYQDLVHLCTKLAIPAHFHCKYQNLPHSSQTRDALPQPGEEEAADDI